MASASAWAIKPVAPGAAAEASRNALREIVMVVYSCLRMDDFFVTQRERGLHHRRAETLTGEGTD